MLVKECEDLLFMQKDDVRVKIEIGDIKLDLNAIYVDSFGNVVLSNNEYEKL